MENDKNKNNGPIDILVKIDFDNVYLREFTNTAKSRAFNATLDFKIKRRRRKEYTADQLGKLYIEQPIRSYLANKITTVEPLNLNIFEERNKLKEEEIYFFINYRYLRDSLDMLTNEISLLENSLLSNYMSLQYIINRPSNEKQEYETQKYHIHTLINTYSKIFMRYCTYSIYLELLSKVTNIKGLEYACLYGWQSFYEHLEVVQEQINQYWQNFIQIELPPKNNMLEKEVYNQLLDTLKENPCIPSIAIIDSIARYSEKFLIRIDVKGIIV